MWYYVFYLYLLKKKKITEMNGIESYIYNKLETDDITWLPLKRALSLEINKIGKDDLEERL